MKPSIKTTALMALGLLAVTSGGIATHTAFAATPSPQPPTQSAAPAANASGSQQSTPEVQDGAPGTPDTDTIQNGTQDTGTEVPDSKAEQQDTGTQDDQQPAAK